MPSIMSALRRPLRRNAPCIPEIPEHLSHIAATMKARGYDPIADYHAFLHRQYPYNLNIAENYGDWLQWPSPHEPPHERLEQALPTSTRRGAPYYSPDDEVPMVLATMQFLRRLQIFWTTSPPFLPLPPRLQHEALRVLERAEGEEQQPPQTDGELRRRLYRVILAHLERLHRVGFPKGAYYSDSDDYILVNGALYQNE